MDPKGHEPAIELVNPETSALEDVKEKLESIADSKHLAECMYFSVS